MKNSIIIAGVFFLVVCMACQEKENKVTSDGEVIMTNDEIKSIQREDPSLPGSVVFTAGEFRGMKLFMHHCNKCHPGGEKGVGPSLNDKPLPDFLIHFQVRNGLGDMPKFTKDQISKEHLKQIILFVRLLRDTK